MAEQEQQQDPRNFVNIFTQGVLTDIDHINFPQGKYKDAKNIELIDRDGQGFVVTLQDGNEQFFSLTTGFKPVGSCYINGILYIFSNADGVGEIGCFPSPTVWSKNNSSFERVYKPLYNYTGATKDEQFRRDMRTSLLKMAKNRLLDVRGKQVYDGSINLYFTDGRNPLRVINTGFDQTGKLTDKIYYDADFKHIINVIRGANGQMNITLKKFVEGGRWKSGNTFLYTRYVSEDFNKTNFLGESAAIALTNFPVRAGVPGNPGTHAIDNYTTKAFEVELTNIDKSYKFLEIAFIRYFSEENGILVKEQKLINYRYQITGSTMTLKLTGFEEFIDIDFEQIIKPNNQENVCETIEIVENRLWGANWTRDKVHDPKLAEHAQRLWAYPKLTKISRPSKGGKLVGPSYEDLTVYGNPENYDKVGYFRGESYLFNVYYVYDDGSESLGYPIRGYDFFDTTPNYGSYDWDYRNTSKNLYISNPEKANDKGIVRFPSVTACPTYEVTRGTQGKGIDYFLMGMVIRQWYPGILPRNVKGYYIARAKRIPNLIAQGIIFGSYVSTVKRTEFPEFQDFNIAPYQDKSYSDLYTMPFADISKVVDTRPLSKEAYWGMRHNYDRAGNIHPTDYDIGENKVIKTMPIYRGYYPIVSYWGGEMWKYGMARAFRVKNHYALFSPDYILDPTKKMNTGVLARFGKLKYFDMYLKSPLGSDSIENRWYENLKNGAIPSGSSNNDYNRRKALHYNGTGYPRTSLLEINETELYSQFKYVSPATIENVERYTTPSKSKKFVSWYKDCGLNNKEKGNQGDESMTYGIQRDDDDHFISNRSMITPRYLGFILEKSDAGKDLEFELVNSYHYNPTSKEYNILDIYNPNNASFSKISRIVDFNNEDSIELFNGDCFLQTTYIKVMGHGGSTLASNRNEFAGEDGSFSEYLSKDSKTGRIGHGLIAMLVTENTINTELRIPVKNRTFFPYEPDPVIHAQINSESKEYAETDVLNWGYQQILPSRTLSAYNFELPETMDYFLNRVRYSNKDIPGSFIDAFSTFEFLSYRDFDVASGPIKRLFNLSGWLVGVCESKLLSFYVNANQVKADPSADNILLGVSDILHENARTMLELGSQHFAGSVNTGQNIVGFDWVNKAIFLVTIQLTEKGTFPVATNKSEELHCKKFIEDIVTLESGLIIDKTNMLPDLPWDGKGIYCSHDNGRVFLSVHGDAKVSFVYNEKLGFIIGKSDFTPVFASNIGKDLVSWNGNNQAWIIFKDAPKSTYFGTQYESYVQSIVNPYGIFEKVFDALVLQVPDSEINRIEYETETQQTVHNFPVGVGTQPWQDPVYKEHKLYVPTYPEATTFYGKIRRVHLRGTWLSIKVVFDRQTHTFLKNIFTKFRISKS